MLYQLSHVRTAEGSRPPAVCLYDTRLYRALRREPGRALSTGWARTVGATDRPHRPAVRGPLRVPERGMPNRHPLDGVTHE
jgi:hypothetical protein